VFRFNIPVTKVDEEKRLVYGLVTEEVVDQSGEILDYETSKAYFQDWSDGIAKATGGSSLGNLRLMHQPIVAGKIVELNFDDALKQISCVAKIVSDDVWKLVLEGCLTGFSMGGKYIKRWQDAAAKGVRRFTAKPVEVSVVDNPCVSTATFEYIKSDGSVELRKFHKAGDGTQEDQSMFTQEQIAARAAELAKAAGTPETADQFMDEALLHLEAEAEASKAAAKEDDEEEDKDDDEEKDDEEKEETEKSAPTEDDLTEAAKTLVQVWQAPDGATFAKKADAAAHVATAEPESIVEKALREARGDTSPALPLADLDADLEAAEKAFSAAVEHVLPLTKGLYEVRELASVLQSMRSITSCAAWEAKSEGDGSAVPAQLMDLLRGLGEALVAMTQEEVSEMLALTAKDMVELGGMPEVASVIQLAARGDVEKFSGAVVQKAGARNSKADASRLQEMHDHIVALGAMCAAEKTVVAEDDDLVKSLRTEIARRDDEIEKAVSGIADLGAELSALRDQVQKFGKTPQPLPPRSDHVVVERMGKSMEVTTDVIAKMSPEERADLAIRLSQMHPTNVGGR
jgi:hypothetical protein